MNARAAIAPILAATLILSGCATSNDQPDSANHISIVTSTNVYADIAQYIGGEFVETQAIISSTSQDPHSYEATAQDRLLMNQADLVIQNGGGYDPFMEIMLEANNADPAVIHAVEVSGLVPTQGEGTDHESDAVAEEEHDHDLDNHAGHTHIAGFNEHIWYHLEAMETLSVHIASELSALQPEQASVFEQASSEFAAELAPLRERLAALEADESHHHVAITETIPLYLLEAAGAHNVTPPAFSEAIEEGFDVAPAVMQDMLNLVSSGEVSLLAYNVQTASAETERIRQRAETEGVRVVEFTEAIPEGHSYLTWMDANIASIETALATEG